MSRELKTKTKNVNSKRLFEEINDFVESGLMSLGITWSTPGNRQSFAEVLEEWLEEFQQDGRITQYNVICDDRNNPVEQQEEGIFKVYIMYKQLHCLNTTSIEYTLEEGDDSVEDLLSFYVTP